MGAPLDTVGRVPAKNRSPLQEDLARRHYEAAFEAYYGRVLAYSLRRSDDRATAEDATAETVRDRWARGRGPAALPAAVAAPDGAPGAGEPAPLRQAAGGPRHRRLD